MSFYYHRNGVWQPLESKVNLPFEQIDEKVVKQVLPNVQQQFKGIYHLLPNGNSSLFPSHGGPTFSHDPKRFLVLQCLEQGLALGDAELWLDACLDKYRITNADGKTRLIAGIKASILRLDQRKPIHRHRNFIYYAVQIREL